MLCMNEMCLYQNMFSQTVPIELKIHCSEHLDRWQRPATQCNWLGSSANLKKMNSCIKKNAVICQVNIFRLLKAFGSTTDLDNSSFYLQCVLDIQINISPTHFNLISLFFHVDFHRPSLSSLFFPLWFFFFFSPDPSYFLFFFLFSFFCFVIIYFFYFSQ